MPRTLAAALLGLALSGATGLAQAPAGAPADAPNKPVTIAPAAQQIAAALLPAPADMRASATVLGYDASGKLVTLRQGTGALVCLASDPRREQFHVACYHRSLEPFMARGRELRASGVKGEQVDTVRFKEIESGKLHMPKTPAALYTLTGPGDSFDPATGTAAKARPLFVIYTPYATAASLGLSAVPSQGTPWVMFPGTPKAHVMFVPKM